MAIQKFRHFHSTGSEPKTQALRQAKRAQRCYSSKRNMADAWNIRRTGELPTNTTQCTTRNVNQELVESLRKQLSCMVRNANKNPLWHEMNTMKCVIYKHHNQHRKEKYFKGLKMVQKHLSRIQEMELGTILSAFINILPKKGVPISTVTRYPCSQAMEYVLLKFMGASKVALQAIGHCKGTFTHVCGQLNHGFFITFHIAVAAALSRIWVLLKDFIQNIIESYEVLYPWLDIVEKTDKNSSQTVLPSCLKTWLGADLDECPTTLHNNSDPKAAFTPKTSSLLDKLFTFTPQTEKREDAVHPVFDGTRDYQDSSNDLLDGSILVPREMFQERNSTHSTSTSVSSKATKKRKGGDIEGLPECKKLFLDSPDISTRTEKGSHGELANRISEDTTWKHDRDSRQTALTQHKTERGSEDERKRHVVEETKNGRLVDSDETKQKRSKKKSKKSKNKEHETIVIQSNNCQLECEEKPLKKSKKKSKKREKNDDVNIAIQSNTFNLNSPANSIKKNSKHFAQETKDGFHIDSDDNTKKKSSKKCKNVEKNNGEAAEMTLQNLSTQRDVNTKKKNKNKMKIPSTSSPDIQALEEGSPKEKKLSKQKKTKAGKDGFKTTGKDNDYFDNLFSALGV